MKIKKGLSREQLQDLVNHIEEMYTHEANIVNAKHQINDDIYLAGHNGMHSAYFNVLSEIDYKLNAKRYEEVKEDD